MPTIESLRSAASAALGIEVVPYGRSSAYFAKETNEWYSLTRADLRRAVSMRAEHGPADAYSLWCACSGRFLRGAT